MPSSPWKHIKSASVDKPLPDSKQPINMNALGSYSDDSDIQARNGYNLRMTKSHFTDNDASSIATGHDGYTGACSSDEEYVSDDWDTDGNLQIQHTHLIELQGKGFPDSKEPIHLTENDASSTGHDGYTGACSSDEEFVSDDWDTDDNLQIQHTHLIELQGKCFPDSKEPIHLTENDASSTGHDGYTGACSSDEEFVSDDWDTDDNQKIQHTNLIEFQRQPIRFDGADLIKNSIYQYVLHQCQSETSYDMENEMCVYSESFQQNLPVMIKNRNANFHYAQLLLLYNRPLSFPCFNILNTNFINIKTLKIIEKNMLSSDIALYSALYGKLYTIFAMKYISMSKFGIAEKFLEKAKSCLEFEAVSECHIWYCICMAIFKYHFFTLRDQYKVEAVIKHLKDALQIIQQMPYDVFIIEKTVILWWMFYITVVENWSNDSSDAKSDEIVVNSATSLDRCNNYLEAYYVALGEVQSLQEKLLHFTEKADFYIARYQKAVNNFKGISGNISSKEDILDVAENDGDDEDGENREIKEIEEIFVTFIENLNGIEVPHYVQRYYTGEKYPKIYIDISQSHAAEARDFFGSKFCDIYKKLVIVEQEEPIYLYKEENELVANPTKCNSACRQPERLKNGSRIACVTAANISKIGNADTFDKVRENIGEFSCGSLGAVMQDTKPENQPADYYLLTASHVLRSYQVIKKGDDKTEIRYTPIEGIDQKKNISAIAEIHGAVLQLNKSLGYSYDGGFCAFKTGKSFMAIDIGAMKLDPELLKENLVDTKYKTKDGRDVKLKLFHGDIKSLKGESVQKLGGETWETHGKIIKTNIFHQYCNKPCGGFFDVYCYLEDFANKGDSGAIIIRPITESSAETEVIGICHSVHRNYINVEDKKGDNKNLFVVTCLDLRPALQFLREMCELNLSFVGGEQKHTCQQENSQAISRDHIATLNLHYSSSYERTSSEGYNTDSSHEEGACGGVQLDYVPDSSHQALTRNSNPVISLKREKAISDSGIGSMPEEVHDNVLAESLTSVKLQPELFFIREDEDFSSSDDESAESDTAA